ALELGAVDFVDKASAGTTMDIHRLGPVIQEKVLAVAGASVKRDRPATAPSPAVLEPLPVPRASEGAAYDLVVIGSSTGGPRALMEVIGALPAGFPAAVVVAQHMPAGFTHTLAERIDRRSAIRVLEARDGMTLDPGQVLIAPGGSQIEVEREGGRLRVRVREATGEYLHRPSVDLLFR